MTRLSETVGHTPDNVGASQGKGASLRDRATHERNPQAVSAVPVGIASAEDDPAYALPLPPEWALSAAARNAGFTDWFAVPATFRTPLNRRVIVEARKIVAVYGVDELAAECRERATYLQAMEPEGLSTLERQCMETLFKAAQAIEARREKPDA